MIYNIGFAIRDPIYMNTTSVINGAHTNKKQLLNIFLKLAFDNFKCKFSMAIRQVYFTIPYIFLYKIHHQRSDSQKSSSFKQNQHFSVLRSEFEKKLNKVLCTVSFFTHSVTTRDGSGECAMHLVKAGVDLNVKNNEGNIFEVH